jgi:hypothetical protein
LSASHGGGADAADEHAVATSATTPTPIDFQICAFTLNCLP